jgi:uncharacterized membrane protein
MSALWSAEGLSERLLLWLAPEGGAGGDFNQASFVWLHEWPTWALTGALALGALAWWLTWRTSARLTRPRRLTLAALRLLTLSLLALFLLEPGARLEDVTRVKNHLAILVDASRSMSLSAAEGAGEGAGGGAQSRWAEAVGELEAQQRTLEALSREHVVTLYTFDEHLSRHDSLEALKALTPRGEATSLSAPLDELLARTPADDLAAVWVISDGVDTAQVPLGAEAAARVRAPIHTLLVGPKRPSADVAIAEVRADDFAFARNAVSVEVDLVARGYREPIYRRVTLSRGAEVLAQRALTYDPAEGEAPRTLSFEFVPEEVGEEAYSVEVEGGPEEAVTQNNLARFSMRVIRDKIRVLQVVGRPSWDERALRLHLQSNPNVELISFFILRTNASVEVASPDELSLIPFPTQELFEERLGSFDLMIFQNFTHRGYQMSRYLPLISDYVRRGGGFVMVGGDQSFSGGGYAGTPIADLLPFELIPNAKDAVTLGDFSPTLSPEGLRHPITALSLSPEENAALWGRTPPLSGNNQVGALKEGAQALLWRRSEPIMAVKEEGEGRVLALTTDSLWRWGFEEGTDAGAAYHKLWGNAIRWLIRDPSLNPLRISSSRERYPLGARVELKAQVLNGSYEPVEGALALIVIEEVSGGSAQGREVARLSLKTEAQGEVTTTWSPEREGVYRARLSAPTLGAEVSAQDVFVVAEDPLELREVAPRADLLGALSEATTGGARLRAGEDWSALERVRPQVMRVNRRVDTPLWSSGWALLLAILAPSLEWLLRRRWGLA